jgi:serine/threonine protein kinase
MVALGAYQHGDQFFILQEEAEQSLHDYLKEDRDQMKSDRLWKQVMGIADGLATLHKCYKGLKIAYHQDLKPANILIVNGVFKIADFGLLVFKPVSSLDDTGSTGVPNAHNTGVYAAPRQGNYTRDSDIWSLGCIISELATFDIQGRDEVKSYKEARTADGQSGKDFPRFFYGQTKVVKKSVIERHSLLFSWVQSNVPENGNTDQTQFRKGFYTKDFFDLLNSTFKSLPDSTDLLEVTHKFAVPSAGLIAETIEKLRSAALPASALNNEIENLNLEQNRLNVEILSVSLGAHLTDFKKVLTRRNASRFTASTLADLKQCAVDLQARQHAERRQQGLSDLKPFLEGFEQFGELIMCLPNATEFMGFVWVQSLRMKQRLDSDQLNRALSDFSSR